VQTKKDHSWAILRQSNLLFAHHYNHSKKYQCFQELLRWTGFLGEKIEELNQVILSDKQSPFTETLLLFKSEMTTFATVEFHHVE
jgi:hypothetical protein